MEKHTQIISAKKITHLKGHRTEVPLKTIDKNNVLNLVTI